jgi:serine/threonine protein kinase
LFRELAQEELIPLLRDLARYLARCTAAGILHRDLSDGNVLVRKEKGGALQFYLLDTNRIRLKNNIGVLKGTKSLIRLGIPPQLQRFFLEEYLVRTPIKKVHWLWYKFHKSFFTGYIRFKELLRLKKLAHKLKIQ